MDDAKLAAIVDAIVRELKESGAVKQSPASSDATARYASRCSRFDDIIFALSCSRQTPRRRLHGLRSQH